MSGLWMHFIIRCTCLLIKFSTIHLILYIVWSSFFTISIPPHATPMHNFLVCEVCSFVKQWKYGTILIIQYIQCNLNFWPIDVWRSHRKNDCCAPMKKWFQSYFWFIRFVRTYDDLYIECNPIETQDQSFFLFQERLGPFREFAHERYYFSCLFYFLEQIEWELLNNAPPCKLDIPSSWFLHILELLTKPVYCQYIPKLDINI